MALYGGSRDISLFRNLNRELLWDIITQQCVFYKFKIEETKVNIYGEAAGSKFYHPPVILNALISRQDQSQTVDEFGVDFGWDIEFRFFRDDMVEANVVAEVGDIILYQESYWEIDNVNSNQFFAGKDPDYPYSTNPLNPGLENFGSNIAFICQAHCTSADRVQITRERL